jgi:alanine-glyoxylate transaminase/serine-glyoxylate transaminase/serine-pyruvate transaminase
MLPPGLGILAVSDRALTASRSATLRRAYFEFGPMVTMNADGQFPYTPPVPLIHGLRAALDRIAAEGLDATLARHRRLAEGVRRGVAAWGLDLVAEYPSLHSDAVTAIRVPEGVDARDVIRIARERFACSLGSGLGRLAGRVFRIGHLGDLNEGMTLTALALSELSLAAAGARVPFGAGVAAAQDWYAGSAQEPVRFRLAAE